MQRWKRRPEGSNWGDFGPDDQIGRLNFLTPETVVRAVSEVRFGRTFCLSLPLNIPSRNVLSKNRQPPVLRPAIRNDRPYVNYPFGSDFAGATDIVSDDLVTLYLQHSTQWDSLAHVGSMFDADGDGVEESVYYNGYRAGDDVHAASVDRPESGALAETSALGVEKIAETCVQGRGVLVDLAAHFGHARTLVGYDLLCRVIEADGIEIEKGDIVCFHTGFAQLLLDTDGSQEQLSAAETCCVLDGSDTRLLNWIRDSHAAALVADNFAVESFTPHLLHGCCAALPLHEHCIFKLGMPLGELWYLTPLANWLREAARSRFLLTAPPLRLPGAFGSPLTPVATV